jgi:hypothetical protein
MNDSFPTLRRHLARELERQYGALAVDRSDGFRGQVWRRTGVAAATTGRVAPYGSTILQAAGGQWLSLVSGLARGLLTSGISISAKMNTTPISSSASL